MMMNKNNDRTIAVKKSNNIKKEKQLNIENHK